jgi:septum formation inhibitor-activating ATPase MinD
MLPAATARPWLTGASHADEVFKLPLLVPIRDADRLIGLTESTARRLRDTGEYPVETILLGRKIKCRRSDLAAFLGVEPSDAASDEAGVSAGQRVAGHGAVTGRGET